MKALKKKLLLGSLIFSSSITMASGMVLEVNSDDNTNSVSRPQQQLSRKQRQALSYKWKQSTALFNLVYKMEMEFFEGTDDAEKAKDKKQTFERIKKLLKRGADFRYKGHIKESALHHAVKTSPKLLELLLKNATIEEINTPNAAGYTALHFAAYHKDSENVKLLLIYGADPKITWSFDDKTVVYKDFFSKYTGFIFESLLEDIKRAEENPDSLESICEDSGFESDWLDENNYTNPQRYWLERLGGDDSDSE